MDGLSPTRKSKGRVTTDRLDATVFKNPQRNPALVVIIISIETLVCAPLDSTAYLFSESETIQANDIWVEQRFMNRLIFYFD